MRRTTRAVTAAVFAAGVGLVAAAPAQAMEISDISDATRIAEGAAVQGTYTVTCTAGSNIFVSLNVTQRVSEGRIANGSYFKQWVCEGGEVELNYEAVAFNMAFDEGPAVLSGFIQECQTEFCGTGTTLPLQVIQISDEDADQAE
ncbi:hypothetical protein [Kocuria arenosa]|uniref:hypothetical protein n=1 Tax=Kocuria arenosa TaxID=3071446 RepID=UPI0034D39883